MHMSFLTLLAVLAQYLIKNAIFLIFPLYSCMDFLFSVFLKKQNLLNDVEAPCTTVLIFERGWDPLAQYRRQLYEREPVIQSS
jgi:hypothetical protein